MANDHDLTAVEVEEARRRRLTAMGLHAIEANPLSSDQVAMFEMFERQSWSHARRREFIQSRYTDRAAVAAE